MILVATTVNISTTITTTTAVTVTVTILYLTIPSPSPAFHKGQLSVRAGFAARMPAVYSGCLNKIAHLHGI